MKTPNGQFMPRFTQAQPQLWGAKIKSAEKTKDGTRLEFENNYYTGFTIDDTYSDAAPGDYYVVDASGNAEIYDREAFERDWTPDPTEKPATSEQIAAG